MLKNITLSADEHLIELAREKARKQKQTLNVLFREWLAQYAKPTPMVDNYVRVMARLAYCNPGKHFHRDELNER